MEIYEEVEEPVRKGVSGQAPEKRKKFVRHAVIFCGIVMVSASAYFFAFGAGNGFLKNNSAIVMQSFREAFGFSLGGHSGEIAVENISASSSSSMDGSARGTVSTITTENENISTSNKRLGFQKSSTGDLASNSETRDVSEKSNDSQAIASASDTAESRTSSSAVPDAGSETALSPALPKEKKSSSKKTAAERCAFPAVNASVPTHAIILNEIAWMGSPAQSGESNTGASNDEWMEIENEAPNAVSLAGWEIIDAAKNITIIFGDKDVLASSSLYLLERTDDDSVPNITVDKIYSGSLPNTGDMLGIFDNHCALVDFLDASDGWPGGDNGTKRTLERDHAGFGWHTSANPGGTPKAENSTGYIMSAASAANLSAISAVSGTHSSSIIQTTSSVSVLKYTVSVAVAGDGMAKVISNPSGISCGSYCEASYSAGQTVTLHAVPGANVVFSGWSGPCSGTADCVFVVTGYISATALFHGAGSATAASSIVNSADDFSDNDSAIALSSDSGNVSSSSDSNDSQSASTSAAVQGAAPTQGVTHLVIAAIQIAGASTTNDYVKIYNPENNAVDVSGWKLHKKSSTGTDYSLREIPTGNSMPAGGYFIWANSTNGFSASVGANVSSTETLSSDNSVALFDATGAIVDMVAWGTGVNQYVEDRAYPTNPAANQVLTRIFQNGAIVDTDNNAADFTVR
jgi:hypothetical protein